MCFDLHSISITNFRSYRGKHDFAFPTEAGLYFLTGNNKAEPRLASNGAGKSTFLDAICWVLYGRTTRGLKSNEVLSWGSPSCQVTLEVTVGTRRLKIRRTQKPISLLLNDKPVDQDELQKHLRLNYDSFKYSVLNAQFEQSFFALPPAAKLTLFSDIMDLSYWLQKSEEASKDAEGQAAGLASLQMVITRNEEKAATISDDIEGLKLNSTTFEDAKTNKVAGLEQSRAEMEQEQAELHSYIESLWARKKNLQNELNNFNQEIKKLTPERNAYRDKEAKLNKKIEALTAKLVMARRQLESLNEIDADCPTCLQHVSTSHLLNEKAAAMKERNDSGLYLETAGKDLKAVTTKLNSAQLIIDNQTRISEQMWNELGIIDDKLARNKTIADMSVTRIRDIDSQIKTAKRDKNPYEALIGSKKQQLKELNSLVAEETEKKHLLEAKHAASSFWVKGFKRLRLFIIEQAFQTLELEVNNCLAQLGMTDWQISFDVERENKSGGVTKGFVVFIQSPANSEPVRWENWSGGETQRLQLAGDLGLANLIMTQAGLMNTIEFYDEASTSLSPEGMMDLANALHERALNEGKRIWIVDHSAITNFGAFEGVILAKKDSHGSSISYNNGQH